MQGSCYLNRQAEPKKSICGHDKMLYPENPGYCIRRYHVLILRLYLQYAALYMRLFCKTVLSKNHFGNKDKKKP